MGDEAMSPTTMASTVRSDGLAERSIQANGGSSRFGSGTGNRISVDGAPYGIDERDGTGSITVTGVGITGDNSTAIGTAHGEVAAILVD